MSSSKLFPNFTRQHSGGAAKTIQREVQRAQQQVGREEHLARRMIQKGMRLDPAAVMRRMRNTPLGKLARDISGMAGSGGMEARLAQILLKQMGPLGQLIQTLATSASRKNSRFERDIDSLTNMFNAFGYEATDLAEEPLDEVISRSEMLERQMSERGSPVYDQPPPGRSRVGDQPRGETGVLPSGYRDRTSRGQPQGRGGSKDLLLDDSSGARRSYPSNDPMITGEEDINILSSHVYSHRYDFDASTLYVRYLHWEPGMKSTDRSGPGATYAYYDVSPEQYRALSRAGSVGTWIWDNLRVRGSVAAHQHRYQLADIVNGYVPRQVVMDMYNGKIAEIYRPRKISVHGTTTVKSSLPRQFIQYYNPKRGLPNDGAPRRS